MFASADGRVSTRKPHLLENGFVVIRREMPKRRRKWSSSFVQGQSMINGWLCEDIRMTSNLNIGIELDFMKLKCSGLSKHIVDENGFPSEDPELGNAETSNGIPDSHKLDWDIWDPLIFCCEHFNSFSIESIVYVAFVNLSKPFNAMFSQEAKLTN